MWKRLLITGALPQEGIPRLIPNQSLTFCLEQLSSQQRALHRGWNKACAHLPQRPKDAVTSTSPHNSLSATDFPGQMALTWP